MATARPLFLPQPIPWQRHVDPTQTNYRIAVPHELLADWLAALNWLAAAAIPSITAAPVAPAKTGLRLLPLPTHPAAIGWEEYDALRRSLISAGRIRGGAPSRECACWFAANRLNIALGADVVPTLIGNYEQIAAAAPHAGFHLDLETCDPVVDLTFA